jgi:hypothetical protein
MAKASFVIQPHLTAISQMYRNTRLIADMILPRVPVLSPDFKWTQYTLEDGFTVPATRVGRKGEVSRIEWSGTEQSSSVFDEGLEDAVPQYDINAAAAAAAVTNGRAPIDPLGRSTMLLTDLIALGREVRTANLVFSAATYPAARKVTLSGTSQWSDYANSNPIDAIMAALDLCLIRPNKAVFGQAVWTKLRQHPKVTAAVVAAGGNASVAGSVVARQAVAELLEIDEVLVGEGWVNVAKKGQSANMTRTWGKHAAFIYQAPVITDPEGAPTFGMTAEYGERVSMTYEDPSIGLRGGTIVKVGESVRELVTAADVGYFFENAVA